MLWKENAYVQSTIVLVYKISRSHRQSENPVLQERINELIRAEQIRAVNERRSSYNTSSKRCWDTVNMITGRQARNAPVSSTIDPKTINLYFQSINTDDQYSTPEVLSIPDGTRIPTIEVHTVWTFLSTLRADVSKYRREVYKSEKLKILKKIHKVALGKLLT